MKKWKTILKYFLGGSGGVGLITLLVLLLNQCENKCNRRCEDCYKWGKAEGIKECLSIIGENESLKTRVEILRDSIELLKVFEKVTNRTDIVRNTVPVINNQIEVLIVQGNKLLQNYEEQVNIYSRFETWRGNCISVLRKDTAIENRFNIIKDKYSSGDYYSQINDIIILLRNYNQ